MRKTFVLAAIAATIGLAAAARASTVSDPNAHAGTITVNPDGSITLVNVVGTYDGNDDVVYNVINNNANVLSGLNVAGTGIGLFDGDGINVYVDANGALLSGKSFGTSFGGGVDPNDYAGPGGNFFTNVLANSVTVNFGGGGLLGNGATSFFSLEAPAGGGQTIIVTPTVPLPLAGLSGFTLLGGIAMRKLFRARAL